MKKLLVLSNGAGEDAIASSILRHLKASLEVVAFPLVGAGSAYPPGMPLWGRQDAPPSQGLSNQSWSLWWKDLRHGLLGRLLGQWRLLRSRRQQVAAVLAVGDLFPCCLAGLAGLFPVYFVGTAKSVHHHAYSALERRLLQLFTRSCVVRDPATAHHLNLHGVNAHYLGNPMMDDTVPQGLDLGLSGQRVLCLFPGSRSQAPQELPRQLRIWASLQRHIPCRAAVALASSLDPAQLAAQCSGWHLEPTRTVGRGWVATLKHPELPEVHLIRDALGDILAHSQLALGQAGTAHEQAVGVGLPVVALHPNPQGPLGWYRGRQKGLLGEALILCPEDEEIAAETLLRLFQDDRERQRLGEIGRLRMGLPGGSRAIAHWLEEHW